MNHRFIIVFLMVSIIILLSPVSAIPANFTIHNSTLKAYYPFNTSVSNANTSTLDFSNNSHTMTMVGSTIDATNKKFGEASILFDSVGDNVTTPASTDWYPTTKVMSFGGWIQFSSYENYPFLLSLSSDGGTNEMVMRYDKPTQKLRFYRFSGGTFQIEAACSYIPSGGFEYILYTNDGTTQHIYIDGTDKTLTTNTNTGIFDTLTAPFELGRYSGGGSNYQFYGHMDDIIFINGDAIDGHIVPTREYLTNPNAEYSANATTGTSKSLSVQFSNLTGDGITAQSWSFADVTGNNTEIVFSTSPNPVKIFGSGNYSINYTEISTLGSASSYAFINVSSLTINANFIISNASGYAPFLTHFSDTSTTTDATIDSWNWSFGDGNISSVQSPDHTFAFNGTFPVNLTITNTSHSLVSTKIQTVTVYNNPPLANFTSDVTSGVPPLAVQFTDTSIGDNIIVWNWSFGDGNLSTTQNPIYTYDYTGEYQVNLTVTNDGGSSTKLSNITVAYMNANFIADSTIGEIPFTVQFTDTSLSDIKIDNWNWSFGDGNISSSQNPTHVYTTPNLYSVNLTIINTTHDIHSTKFMNIEVFDKLFETDFSALPYAYTNVNNALNFNATILSGTPTGYIWDFNGGTSIDNTSISPSYTYTTTGFKSVNFTVYNSIGGYSLIKTDYIQVFGPGVPYAQFSALTTTGTPGAFISFVDHSLFGTSTGLVCNWSFGDSIYTISPYSSICGDVGHVYTYAGIYDVSLNITNANGTSVETKTQYIKISTIQQTQTTFYTPKTIQFHVTDIYGNSLSGATVNANFNQTTLPSGWLISNFGMNEQAANQALNGTLIMSGLTSSTGDIVYTMNSAIGYDVTVTYGGHTNYYFIYPASTVYNLKFVSTPSINSTYTDLFSSGKTGTWFTTPDANNVTLWWSFQDLSGLTTRVDYYVVDFVTNATIYHTFQTSPGTSQYMLNWTEPNVRGEQRIWYMNITRSV